MAIVVINENLGNVIKIDGVCYEYNQTTTNATTHDTTDVTATFSTCDDCNSSSSSSSASLSYVSGCNHFGCTEDIPTDITVTFSGLNTTNFPGVNGTPITVSYVGIGSCQGYGCTWEGSIGGLNVEFITGIGLGFDSWYVGIGLCSDPTQCYYEFLMYDDGGPGGFPGDACDPRVGSIPKYSCWYAGCSDTSDCWLENPTASISY